MKSVVIEIFGIVHGIGFRYFIKNHALRLQLQGYVENTENSVEVYCSGSDENIDKLIELCKQGSPLSKVIRVSVTNIKMKQFSGFEIR